MISGLFQSINSPNSTGPQAAPKSIPEYTKPKTLPDAPFGVPARIIKSLAGPAIPPPKPIKAKMIGTVHPGNTPSPAITAMIPEIKKAVVITRSGSGIFVATKPPAIKPRALEIIKSV